jgi:hypothetical protein
LKDFLVLILTQKVLVENLTILQIKEG